MTGHSLTRSRLRVAVTWASSAVPTLGILLTLMFASFGLPWVSVGILLIFGVATGFLWYYSREGMERHRWKVAARLVEKAINSGLNRWQSRRLARLIPKYLPAKSREFVILATVKETPSDVIQRLADIAAVHGDIHVTPVYEPSRYDRMDPYTSLLANEHTPVAAGQIIITMMMNHSGNCPCRHRTIVDTYQDHPEFFTPESESRYLIAAAVS